MTTIIDHAISRRPRRSTPRCRPAISTPRSSHLDPDVRITYYGTEDIPYAGDYRGIEEATTFFTKVGLNIAIVEMEAWKFIAQGDDLATWGRQRFRHLATGNEWESEFAHIITLRDGRWLHFRDFMNSALTLQAFTR